MRVLGLDISKDAIACVEIETAFGRFEIRETHEIPFASDADFTAYDPASSAYSLIEKSVAEPHRLVTALPVEYTTFRNLSLATKDRKAIKSALEFELEDDLPFERENLHYEASVLESGNQGSLIHIGACKKEVFGTHLANLLSHNIDPDIITTDAWAYRSLMTRLFKVPTTKGETSSPVLLLGFERHKTFFYVHFKNRPILYREVPFGIKTLERKLNDSLGASQEELRTWVNDIGVTGIDEQVSNAIQDILEALIPELKQIELSSRSLEKAAIEEIYVTGEGALLPGFMQWLSEATGKKVDLFRPLSGLAGPKVTYSDLSEIRYTKALALAMTTISVDKISPLNLRKGDFKKAEEEGNSPLELIKKPLPYLLIMLCVFAITKSVEYQYYKGKLTESEDSLKKGVKSYFGNISDNSARVYLADLGKLKKTIEKDLAKERELSQLFSPNTNSPLEFLRTLSQKIGKDIVLDLVSFESGADNTDKFVENKPLRTSLTFQVSNPQAIAKLSEILERGFNFKKGNSEEVTKEGRKMYRVTFGGTLGSGK